jgi:hypothetical protein
LSGDLFRNGNLMCAQMILHLPRHYPIFIRVGPRATIPLAAAATPFAARIGPRGRPWGKLTA